MPCVTACIGCCRAIKTCSHMGMLWSQQKDGDFWGVCKSGEEIQKCPEPDAPPGPFCRQQSFKHQRCSLSRKNWRDAAMELRNQIAPCDLKKCFIPGPWLACGMRGEGGGFVMACEVAERAPKKAAASLEKPRCRFSFQRWCFYIAHLLILCLNKCKASEQCGYGRRDEGGISNACHAFPCL